MKSRVKNLLDSRYINVQKRFDKTIELLIRQGHLAKMRVKAICRLSKVNVSTFYDHYRNVDDAIRYAFTRKEKEIHQMKREVKNASDLKIVYLKIFYHIWKNSEYYEMITYYQYDYSLKRILEIFQPIICCNWHTYNKNSSERIFCILCGEFCGVVFYWAQKENFNEAKIEYYATKMVFLTNNACARLK